MTHKPYRLLAALALSGCATVQPNAITTMSRRMDVAYDAARQYAARGHSEVVTLHGPSMTGLINDGDVIVVDRDYPYASLKAGDVVQFANPDAREGSTVHMLYDCGSRGWRTYGVANWTIDSRPMTEREYMGKVTLIIHTTKE